MTNTAQQLLSSYPTFDLLHGPTPLEPLARLTEYLGGPKIWIKRDDCTGLAMGGNKARKLEFVVADALAAGADILITTGSPQSNHARQTAAAAVRAGLKCDLLLAPFSQQPTRPEAAQMIESGNLMLDKLLGATIHRQATEEDLTEGMRRIARSHEQDGAKPYIIEVGASSALGALGYVSCAAELSRQFQAAKIEPEWIIEATGSCGTQAGLVAGLHLLEAKTRVVGIAVSPDGDQEFRNNRVGELVGEVLNLAGDGTPPGVAHIDVNGRYCGPDYGVPDDSTWEAIELLAQLEGIFLDPVYTGKAMAGLIDLIRRGFFSSEETVVFLHTGGTPALFAYADLIGPGLDPASSRA